MYTAGNLGGFLENGEIEFGGSKDAQVKIRGKRVELGEIEITLMKGPNVNQTIVILREDCSGKKELVAY